MYKMARQSMRVSREAVDQRIQATNEALQAIRMIKFMAYEGEFIEKIIGIREKEMSIRFKTALYVIWGSMSANAQSVLVIFTSLLFYTVNITLLDRLLLEIFLTLLQLSLHLRF